MVALRGTRDGLMVSLGEGEWSSVMADLKRQLARPQARSFFRGALVSVDAGARALDAGQVQELSELFSQHEMMLMVLTGSAQETQALSEALNLRPAHLAVERRDKAPRPPILGEPGGTRPAAPHAPETLPEVVEELRRDGQPPPEATESKALLVRRTVRSGQVIRYPLHVVVYGDVNPGGQVIAGGDVIVWGNLRGVVHAGAEGDETAVVAALYLGPTQLRIGSHIARAPDERKRRTPVAEVARVQDGRIVIEGWSK